MPVFDSGSFSRQDKLERRINRHWKDGYKEGHDDGFHYGYKAALDRYIPVDRDDD